MTFGRHSQNFKEAMSFIPAVEREILRRSTNPEDNILITLKYLLENAVGRENAIPIQEVINATGISVEYKHFQQQIMGSSRHSDYFIGSGRTGIYLIASPEDLEAMQRFYLIKMRTQERNFNNLAGIAQKVGWRIPTVTVDTTHPSK